MSYIRSGSNPEKLYIWGDSGNTIHIVAGSENENTIPENILHGLIRKWHRESWGDVEFKGASLKSVWIKSGHKNENKIQFSYNDWKYIMWHVTWNYIACTNLENINRNVSIKNKIIIS